MNVQVQNAVKAVFATNRSVEIFNLANKAVGDVKLRTFPEQFYRVLQSIEWSVKSDYVSLMLYKDEPVHGQAPAGSRESAEGKACMPDNRAEEEKERLQLMADAKLLISAIHRKCESLADTIAKGEQEAGKKTTDGGRVRFALKRSQGSKFKPFHTTFGEWCVSRIAETDREDSPVWHAKLHTAKDEFGKEIVMDIQQSDELINGLFNDDGEIAEPISRKAAQKLIERLAHLGQAMTEHERLQAAFNLSKQTDEEKKAFAKACKAYNKTKRDSEYWINRSLEATELLAASDELSKELTSSIQWKTAQANLEAEIAMAEAAEVQSKTMRIKAELSKLRATEILEEMEDELEAQAEELRQMRAARIARQKAREEAAASALTEAPASAPTEAPTEAPASTPTNLAPRVHNGRGAAGFNTH